jgi:PAS domain-containing protein
LNLSTDPTVDLAPARERAREIVDGLGEGFLSVDADWRLTDCNPPAERLLHQARGDILGLKLWDIAGLASDSPFAELGRRVVTKRTPEEAEISVRIDGRIKILAVRAFPLGGGMAAMWRDVTRARAAERQIAVNARRFHEVAEGAPMAAWLSRGDGKLEFINQTMVEDLGRPARELLGEGWMAAIHPDDRAALLIARAEARACSAACWPANSANRPS